MKYSDSYLTDGTFNRFKFKYNDNSANHKDFRAEIILEMLLYLLYFIDRFLCFKVLAKWLFSDGVAESTFLS